MSFGKERTDRKRMFPVLSSSVNIFEAPFHTGTVSSFPSNDLDSVHQSYGQMIKLAYGRVLSVANTSLSLNH